MDQDDWQPEAPARHTDEVEIVVFSIVLELNLAVAGDEPAYRLSHAINAIQRTRSRNARTFRRAKPPSRPRSKASELGHLRGVARVRFEVEEISGRRLLTSKCHHVGAPEKAARRRSGFRGQLVA